VRRIDQVVFLAAKVPWFGAHSGEAAMLSQMSHLTKVRAIYPTATFPRRCVGKLHSQLRRWPPRNQYNSFAELHAWLLYRTCKNSVLHLLRSEEHTDFLSIWDKPMPEIMGTIHLPVALWTETYRKTVARMSSALVYFTAEMEKIGALMRRPNIKFVHLAADTDFFKPDFAKVAVTPNILYSGVYLRNEPMLVRVVQRLHAKVPTIKFRLLVPEHHRKQSALGPLAEHPAVTWHAGLNDEQLRELYQTSYLMMLPMNASGANTAVVDALASGLPLVTTDVGGVRDYGGGTVFPLVANDDDDAMVAMVEKYVAGRKWRDEIAADCRRFAEAYLTPQLAAQKHMQAYQELTA
jgi:glycosyltransferase involved in cell wall biosynthesis